MTKALIAMLMALGLLSACGGSDSNDQSCGTTEQAQHNKPHPPASGSASV